MQENIIYKITPRKAWLAAKAKGQFLGAPVDLEDGYIHFSTGAQVEQTAAKHFANQDDLLLIAVDGAQLGDALKWEISRGGALFPHLYAPLDMAAVVSQTPIPMNADGSHQLPSFE